MPYGQCKRCGDNGAQPIEPDSKLYLCYACAEAKRKEDNPVTVESLPPTDTRGDVEALKSFDEYLNTELARARHIMKTSAHGRHVDEASTGEDYLLMIQAEFRRRFLEGK
jgi:hypothetical protein